MDNVPGYTLAYNVQVENIGWLRDVNDTSTWFTSGEFAGTTSLGLRLEGIRIELLKVNEAYVAYQEALNSVDEDDYTIDSWTTYQRVVKAYAVTDSDDEDVIEMATDAVIEAQKKLVKGMNLKKYKEALANAAEENYTPESWEVYAEIVSENVVSQANTQEEIDEATKNILEGQKLLEPKVNLTEYLELLDSVRETDYTALSWFFYQQTVNGNQVGVKNTQTEVNAAVAKIEAAKKKLVRKFDFTAYNALLDAVKEEDYKTISWGKYQTVVDEYYVDENDTQSKIEEAILAIEEAQKALEKGSDLTGYNAVLNKVDKNACTTASWAIYQKVVAANIVSKDSSQEDVDKATQKILDAQLKLVGLGDLTEYKAVIAKVNETDYTTKSWETYQKVVLANVVTEASGQIAIDAATKKIQDAQLKLVPAGILDEYNALLAEYASHEDEWSISSWTAYLKVVSANIMTRDNSQSQINSAINKLKVAYAKLVPRGDIAAYNALIAKAEALKDTYTDGSWKTYQKVVMANYVTTGDSQTEIDAAIKKITVAQLALVTKGNLDAYLALITDPEYVNPDNFTTKAWADYQAVLDANEMTYENTDDEIKAAMIKISAAQQRLDGYKAANMTFYNRQLDLYASLNPLDYTTTSWEYYVTTIEDNVVTKDNTQVEVDAATKKIKTAYEALKFATDMSEFNKVLDLYLQDLAGTIDLSIAATPDSLKAYTDFVEKYAGTYDAVTGKWSGGLVSEASSQDYITAVAEDGMVLRNGLYPSNAALATEYERYLGSLNLEAPHVQTDYIIPAYDDYEAAKASYKLDLPVIFTAPAIVKVNADLILAARNALTGQERADSTSTAPFATEVAAYQSLVGGKSNYTNWVQMSGGVVDPNGTYYQNLYEKYFADPATAYDPSYQTNADYNLATKKLREARTTLIYTDKSVANVVSQLTAEAIRTQVYRSSAEYNASGIPVGTDLEAAINAWLDRTYSNYDVTVVSSTVFGSTATIKFTITDHTTDNTSGEITLNFNII
jgi:enamine deaminase RidA (YjgF/YER057c/UK114 family)